MILNVNICIGILWQTARNQRKIDRKIVITERVFVCILEIYKHP